MVDSDALGAEFVSADTLREQVLTQVSEGIATLRELLGVGFGFADARLEDVQLSAREARILEDIEGHVATAAVAAAGAVVRRRLGTLATHCSSCGRRGPFARVVVHKPTACGQTETQGRLLAAGFCPDCVRETSEEFRLQVVDLVRAAERLEQILSLVCRGAARELGPWWGTLGACRTEDAEAARVDVRRAIERMKVRAS